MPRLVNRPPKLRRHPSGQAIVSINKRIVYLGKFGTKAAKVAYHRVLGEAEANGGVLPDTNGDVTIAELVEAHDPYAEANYPASMDSIKQACRYLLRLYGPTPAAAFGPLALQAIANQMVADGKARSYVNSLIGRIKRLFKWAASRELVTAERYRSLLVVSGERKGKSQARETDPVGPVDDATVDATLPHLTPIVADMVRIQRLIGCRPGELCGMTRDDVDRSGQVWVFSPIRHKTAHRGHARRIAIGPKAQAILGPYLDGREPDAFCFIASEAKRKSKRRQAKPYDDHSYRRAVARACEAAFGMPVELRKPSATYLACLEDLKARRVPKRQWVIPDDLTAAEAKRRAAASAWRRRFVWSPNQLRHSFGTKARQWGGLEAAQVALGHAHAKVTEVYAERDASLADKVALAIG